jgi:hypothetical protein
VAAAGAPDKTAFTPAAETPMTPRERRGAWVYWTLVVLIALDKLSGVGLALSDGLGQVNWWRGVILPLCPLLGMIFLRDGDRWLRWLMGVVLIAAGGLKLFAVGRVMFKLAEVGTPESNDLLLRVFGLPVGVLVAKEVLYMLAGVAILALPSLRAYFEYRRVGRHMRALADMMVVRAIAAEPSETTEEEPEG